MSQRQNSQYAAIGRAHVARPFDTAAARALIDELAARTDRRGGPTAHRTHPNIVTDRPVEAEPARPHAPRWLGYGIAASLTLLALAAAPTSRFLAHPSVVAPPGAERVWSAPVAAATEAPPAASPRAQPSSPVRLASAVTRAALSDARPSRGVSEASKIGPTGALEAAQSAPQIPAAPRLEMARLTAPEPPSPPEIQVAALDPPASAAGQPLILAKSQSTANLLGEDARNSPSGRGLGGIQSGNPQRMVSAITAGSGR